MKKKYIKTLQFCIDNDLKYEILDQYFWWCTKENILDLINSQEKLNKFKEYQKFKENKNNIKYTKIEILQLLDDLEKDIQELISKYPNDRIWERMFPHTIEEIKKVVVDLYNIKIFKI